MEMGDWKKERHRYRWFFYSGTCILSACLPINFIGEMREIRERGTLFMGREGGKKEEEESHDIKSDITCMYSVCGCFNSPFFLTLQYI